MDPRRAFWPAGWQAIAEKNPSVPFSNSISPIDNKVAKSSGIASEEVDARIIEEVDGTAREVEVLETAAEEKAEKKTAGKKKEPETPGKEEVSKQAGPSLQDGTMEPPPKGE